MNKKIIKYLIWTILLAAVLILMPVNKTRAEKIEEITINYYGDGGFETNRNLFCLNKGQPFALNETFEVYEFTDDKFMEMTTKTVDVDVLNYIACESSLGNYGNKENIGSYIPQKAIWKLAGTSVSSQEADKLIANAYAYNKFIDAGSPTPTIEKYGTDGVAIKYYKAASTYNSVDGSYTNLLFDTISVTGASTNDEDGTAIGNGYYRIIYTKNSGAAQATISFRYETSREATLKIYDADERLENCAGYNNNTLSESNVFWRIGETYYHYDCDGYMAPCFKVTISQIKDNFKLPISFVGIDTEWLEILEENGYKFYSCGDSSHPIFAISSSGIQDVRYIQNRDEILGTYYLSFTSYALTGTGSVSTIYPQNLLYGTGSVSTGSDSDTISFIPPVTLNFTKEDFSGNNVSGATIKVTGHEKVSKIEGRDNHRLIDSDEDGDYAGITVYPSDLSGEFELKVKEESAPTGYQKMPSEVILIVKYNVNTGEVESITESSEYITSSGSTVTIKNKPQIEKLTLLKVDSQDSNTKLQGATFKITLTNVESIGGYSSGTKSGKIILSGAKTDKDGELYIEDLVIKDPSKDVTITIEETSSIVGYKKINGKITVTLKRDGTSYATHSSTKDSSVLDTEFAGGNVSVSSHQVSLTIKNIPVMNLGGIVWEDTQSGDKVIAGPDGKYNNNEQGMAGIKVELYKADGTLVTKDAYGNNLMTKTSSGESLNYALYKGGTSSITLTKGQYVFPNIEKGSYYVRFTYDGINYETVKLSSNAYGNNNESKVSDEERDAFNAKFTTISSGKATGSKGNIALSYTDSTQSGATVKTSRLVTKDQNGNVLSNYAITARTGTNKNITTYLKSGDNWKTVCWNNDGTIKDSYAQDINCGLVKKNFDLALTTNIEKAEVTINGASTEYTDFAGPITINNQPASESGTDNLYLYGSDYNYRKSDYVTDKISNVTNEKINNNVNPDNVEGSQIAGEELEVYVTYKISLINQTPSKKANVDKFVYYYDSRYTLIESDAESKGYEIKSNTNNEITFEKLDKNAYMTDRIELTLKFRVNKYDLDGDGTTEIKLGDYGNAGEIIQYSTKDGGLIDKDSAPGNSGITRTAEGKATISSDEDDSDQAKGLNIQIKEDKIRKISGTVFEDTKTGEGKQYNGKKDGSEQGIEGVKVQLIEIIYDGAWREYIWQEKTTNEFGYYEFTNFIPSGRKPNRDGIIHYNYIVRFIYGDGAAYDLTPNTTEYNGQDYKSTKDPNYGEASYNHVMLTYEEGASVARDNEARRLEVMAHSSIVDGKVGTALEIFAKDTQYDSLTDAQKADIVGYYNSVVKTEYESVKDAVEETNPDSYLVAKRIRNIFGNTLPDITTENIDEDLYNKIKRYVSFRTWMCAETSLINIQVDADDKTDTDSTEAKSSDKSLEFNNINFGLALRPNTNIALEKHITALKITPSGTGVQSIVDAKAKGKDGKEAIESIVNGDVVEVEGATEGLATIKSTVDNRGFWQVATDVEELMQGAELEVEYTYVLKNDSDADYLSNTLVNEYEKNPNGYSNYLLNIVAPGQGNLKNNTKGNTHKYGTYLGQFYYTGNKVDSDVLVSSRVEKFAEALNNDFAFDKDNSIHFESANNEPVAKKVYGVDKENGTKEVQIETVVQNKAVSEFLIPSLGNKYTTDTADWSKTIKLTTTLATVSGGEMGANLPSYIAEILQYSNAAGRRNMNATPANLGYVHSDDNNMTMKKNNEVDEFWAESIIITKPTGEDKLTPIQIVIITISSLAVLGVGIVLIKKFVLKK